MKKKLDYLCTDNFVRMLLSGENGSPVYLDYAGLCKTTNFNE